MTDPATRTSPGTDARERAYEAARENLREAWAALAMIREAVETLAPSGSVKAAEHLDGPTFMHEADALVASIVAIGGVAQACGWQPIETVPKDDSGKYPIQVCGGGFRGTSIAWWSGELHDATHWAPMLSPVPSTMQAPPAECRFPNCNCPGGPLDPVCAVVTSNQHREGGK